MDNLLKEADAKRLTVNFGAPPNGWRGSYCHATRTITIDQALGPVQQKSTLAHELGHAHYGHTGHAAWSEKQAISWAVQRLISTEDLYAAWCESTDIRRMAPILGVLPEDVDARLDLLTDDEASRFWRHLCELPA